MKRTHALAMSVFGLLSVSSFSGCGSHSPSANAVNPLPLPTVTDYPISEPLPIYTSQPGPILPVGPISPISLTTTTTTGPETTQMLTGSVPGGAVSLTETSNGYGMTTISGITPEGSVLYTQTGSMTTCVGGGCGSLSNFYGSSAYSEAGSTKDVDLQQAQLQEQQLDQEASAIRSCPRWGSSSKAPG